MDTEKNPGRQEYGADSSGSDKEGGEGETFQPAPPAQGLLHQKLQGRHMQMIAIGKLQSTYTSPYLES